MGLRNLRSRFVHAIGVGALTLGLASNAGVVIEKMADQKKEITLNDWANLTSIPAGMYARHLLGLAWEDDKKNRNAATSQQQQAPGPGEETEEERFRKYLRKFIEEESSQSPSGPEVS